MRIHYFDNFRAIAISLIILGHCYNGWVFDSMGEIIFANAITGGTALFVFISGFFLHAVFYKNFHYKTFIFKKFQRVLVPYLFLSALYIGSYYVLKGFIPFETSINVDNEFLRFIIDMLTGIHLLAYWYIPFIFLVFLLSPIILPFLELNKTTQVIIILMLFVVSALLHRPENSDNPLHSLIYFMPFYLLGAFYSLNRNEMERFVSSKFIYIATMWVISLFIMLADGQLGNAHRAFSFEYAGVDWMVLQKIFLIFLIIGILIRYANIEVRVLNFIASISFPLFFIHPWVLSILGFSGLREKLPEGLWSFLLLATVVYLLSVFLAVMAMKILGKFSKYIVGA